MMPHEAQRLDAADRLRHLVADAAEKMDEEGTDRTYVLEDLMSHVLDAATDLDGQQHSEYLQAQVGVRLAYDLRPRAHFGDLSGERIR